MDFFLLQKKNNSKQKMIQKKDLKFQKKNENFLNLQLHFPKVKQIFLL